MRILALDWGSVRIGAAVSDESGLIAFPLGQYIESKQAVDQIQKLCRELGIEKILIGNPKSLSGQNSKSSQKVFDFLGKLKKQISVPIEFLDERFSSVAAGKALSEQGLSEKKQRPIKDNIAAQMMLQQYLDKQKTINK